MTELAPVHSGNNIASASTYLMLALGETGGGKTSLFLTHPGKKFCYFFDPNATRTVYMFKDSPGFQLDYLEFYPEKLNLNITSLKKGVGDVKSPADRTIAQAYLDWEKDFDDRCEGGFFDSYDLIGLDSITTFGDLVMDRILELNKRPGEWPHQDDYGPQMNAIAKVMRTLTAMGKDIFVTGHYEMKQDEMSKRIFFTPMVTGRLRTKLPLLFSEIWRCEADCSSDGIMKYTIQVKPDRLTPLIRSTMRGFDKTVKYDVTIDPSKDLTSQGLGKILRMQR